MSNRVFIDMSDVECVIHWLGIPYVIESSFRRRFYNVMDCNDKCVTDNELERKVLTKFSTLNNQTKQLTTKNNNYMENLNKQYRDLEMRVMHLLRESVNNSPVKSEYRDTKAIKVNVFGYTELIIVHDRLTFLDGNGHEYSIYSECDLEDLIDILNEQES